MLRCCLDTNNSTVVELGKRGLENLPAITHSIPVCWCVVVEILNGPQKEKRSDLGFDVGPQQKRVSNGETAQRISDGNVHLRSLKAKGVNEDTIF